MCFEMSTQVRLRLESRTAHFTVKRPVLAMERLVIIQPRFAGESFATHSADVGAFAGVESHVVGQPVPRSEVHPADVALERLFAGVRLDVFLERQTETRREIVFHCFVLAIRHVLRLC